MRTVHSKDGTPIAYDQVGQGPTLILVGGALTQRTFAGAVQLADLMSTSFTVINYDRRGRGDSGDAQPYQVEREIEDLAALIAAESGSAYLYGISSGAALALRAAAAGLPVRGLALYEPPFVGVDQASPQPPSDHRARAAALISAGRRGDAITFFLHKVMGAPIFLPWILRLMPVWKSLKAVAHTVPYDLAILGDFGLPSKTLQAITVPTLVIAGGRSPRALRVAAQAVAEGIPQAQFRLLEGQSHNVSMPALAPVLETFFKG